MSTVGVIRPLMALCPLLIGVACASAPPPEPAAAFGEIQVYEATIAHGVAEARRCPAGGSCPPAARTCEAAARLCAVADALQDADAQARCGLARRRCRAVRR